MAALRRSEMERESILEQIKVDGATILNRKKFVLLGNGKNMSRAVIDTWLDSWREYVGDEKANLKALETTLGSIILWDAELVERGPKDLSTL